MAKRSHTWTQWIWHYIHRSTAANDKFYFIRRQVGLLINILLIGLLVAILYQNQEILPFIGYIFTPRTIISSLVLYLLSLVIQFLIWFELMDYRRLEYQRAIEEYIQTIFMGRLPGGLWKLVGRITVYRAPRLSPKTIIIVNLIEIILSLLACFIILLLTIDITHLLRIAGIGTIIALLSGISMYVGRFFPQLRLFQQRWRWFIWVCGFMGAWLCGGLIVYLVASPLSAMISLGTAIMVWCVAGGIGLIFQVLPLSVLIRDATIAGLLQSFMPLSSAIVAAFAVRMIMMVSELVVGWMLLAIARSPWFQGHVLRFVPPREDG